MRLTWSQRAQAFEAIGTPQEGYLPRNAGFLFDSRRRIWYTREVAKARQLSAFADERLKLRLGSPPASETAEIKLYWCAARGRFESTGATRTNYRQKDAGFFWDPRLRLWFTSDPDAAHQLLRYSVDLETAKRITAGRAGAERIRAASRSIGTDLDVPCPPGVNYYSYQKAGVHFCSDVWNRGIPGVLVTDQMGVGKTPQAIGVLNLHPEIKRVLCLCPATLKVNWAIEARRWLIRPYQIRIGATQPPKVSKWQYVTPGGQLPLTGNVLFILNYDVLEKYKALLHQWTWDLLIADECHKLKGQDAKRSRFVFGVPNKKKGEWQAPPIPVKRSAMLTGSPIVNKPVELWSLLHYTDPETWRSRSRFEHEYCGRTVGPSGRVEYNPSPEQLQRLQEKMRGRNLLRRLKREVLAELPPKVRQIIEIPANSPKLAMCVAAELSAEKTQLSNLEALQLAADRSKASANPEDYKLAVSRLRKARAVAFEEIARVRRETAVAKIPLVVDYARQALEESAKIAIFGHHREVLEHLQDEFDAAYVWGGMTTEAKQGQVERFQSDPEKRVFVGAITIAEGYTITAASRYIGAELDWRPGVVSQSEDRLHRISQKDTVFVQHLVLEGSLDARMAYKIVEKQEWADQALDRRGPAPRGGLLLDDAY